MRTLVEAGHGWCVKGESFKCFFGWEGGAYVELGYFGHDDEWHAVEAYNVWDYKRDRPTITSLAAWAEEAALDACWQGPNRHLSP